MTTPRSADDEARDPSTSPERLLELTQQHPQLQGLIVTNPSCPDVAKDWILATNPEAKELYEQQQAPSADASDESGRPGQEPAAQRPAAPPVVPESRAADDGSAGPGPKADPDPEADPEPESVPDPDAVSVWGDLFEPPPSRAPAPAPAPAPSAEQSPSVHVTSDSGVVPLGPAAGPAPAPADRPAPTAALPPIPATGPAPVAAAPPAGAQDTAGQNGGRRWLWPACGGCLVLAIVLLIVAIFGARALLSGDDDTYQRPTSDSATEQAEQPEEAEDAAAEEATEEDPVSPAPDGAVEMDALSSPTGNITCSLEGESVGCSVADRDFSESGLQDCSDGPYSIQVAGSQADSACGQTFGSESAASLEYGDSAVSGEVACTSEFDGMTCWNTQTGKGFFVNRVTYETF